MADKCANCGKAVVLEPDANGGLRFWHKVKGTGTGEELSAYCADGGTIVLAEKAGKAEAEDDDQDTEAAAETEGGD